MNKDLCVRCGKETAYDINTPITVRLYFVEGAGQLCEECWMKLWPAAMDSSNSNENKKGNEMQFIWFNKDGRKRTATLLSIGDIEQHEEDGLFCLKVKKAFAGGTFAAFKKIESREKAYADIKEAIEEGVEEFEFRPSRYER